MRQRKNKTIPGIELLRAADPEGQDTTDEGPSKSARKRAMTALQNMGEWLADRPLQRLAKAPISDTLREGIAHYQSIRSHEAKRRQRQWIGKQMRHEDIDAIRAWIDINQR